MISVAFVVTHVYLDLCCEDQQYFSLKNYNSHGHSV